MDWYDPTKDNGWGLRGKPVEDVVRQYFGGNLPKNVSGTSSGDRIIGGSGRDVLTGNGGNDHLLGWTNKDTLKGGTGNDYLYGGDGNDMLYGNAGKDSFVFDTKPHKATNKDAIKDFKVVNDTIRIENNVFSKAGPDGRLKLWAFWANNTGKAHDRDDRIIYDKDSGIL